VTLNLITEPPEPIQTEPVQLFRHWQGQQKVVMHLEHKAADQLFIDFAAGPAVDAGPQRVARMYISSLTAVNLYIPEHERVIADS
jgi:hypothetical protein